jgi:hypothetical protein
MLPTCRKAIASSLDMPIVLAGEVVRNSPSTLRELVNDCVAGAVDIRGRGCWQHSVLRPLSGFTLPAGRLAARELSLRRRSAHTGERSAPTDPSPRATVRTHVV